MLSVYSVVKNEGRILTQTHNWKRINLNYNWIGTVHTTIYISYLQHNGWKRLSNYNFFACLRTGNTNPEVPGIEV